MDLVQNVTSALLPITSSQLLQPIMHGVSSLLLLGSCAVQSVLGRPDVSKARREGVLLKRAVDDFIATESDLAIEQLLCNIGANGCHADGAGPGLVVASPSKSDPDYWYTWTRDAALVFKALVERLENEYDADIQTEIVNYIVAQSKLQTVSNPSGDLSDGRGLGEAKYQVDGTAFTDAWGRPQRDGPALRAITMIKYSKWLVANGYKDTATDLVWPVIRNDLAYVAQYWNQTGFDLWEEVQGSSFFTVASQHRALVEGNALAKSLGDSCSYCDDIAPQVLCFLQTFWADSEGYVISNINANNGRSGKDANSALTANHNFDPALECDAATFQPCSDKALSSHKVWVDSFRDIYSINSGIDTGAAVAVGRYPEDTYYNGNPWYLNTLAAAEQLYSAMYVWDKMGSITVTDTSLEFFKALVSSVSADTYDSDSDTYKSIMDAVSTYADGFIAIVQKYADDDGHMAEQFDRNNGGSLSATDLTWSYASFLSAVARRQGIVPGGWAGDDAAATSVPDSCMATSVGGSYSTAIISDFPAGQTPSSGGSSPSTTMTGTATTTKATTTKATATKTTTACAQATAISITFTVKKETQFGQTVKIVGNNAKLGNWDTSKGVALSASKYTNSNPVWSGAVEMPVGEKVQYKYIVTNKDGSVVWEADPNRAYSVATGCSSEAEAEDVWQN
ncbi:family 15 glycosyl hydrolase [Astrocystis sublimbata]|nr:family 15 glycosyl hydrolase [Astrocystis sublimbata]